MEELHSIGSVVSSELRSSTGEKEQGGVETDESLHFQAALAIDLNKNPRKEKREVEARERVVIELGDNTTEAEAVSYRLYEDGSLNYADRICAGTYDIWGDFAYDIWGDIAEAPEGAAVVKFPSLTQLASVPCMNGDSREVIVVDHCNDTRLRQIESAAAAALWGCVKDGALACVQALARVVSEHLGGPSSHAELSKRHRVAVAAVKKARQSLVIPIGELSVGVSRHRSLLLKALMDECSFACRILRGSYLLGVAGESEEASVALVQIHEQEYMVELVTEPGRIIPLQRESVPLPNSAAAWGMPANSKLSPPAEASMPAEVMLQDVANPSASSQGPPGQSQQIGESITGPSTTAESGPSERVPKRPSGGSSDTESSESQAGLKWGDGEELTDNVLESVPEDDSAESPAAARDSAEGPQLMEFPDAEGSGLPGQRTTKSEESVRPTSPSVPVAMRKASEPLLESPVLAGIALQRRQSLIEAFRSGKAPRARVRGKDASGHMVELELEVEGLTVTHQGQAGRRSLESLMPRPPPFQKESDTRQLRSLESLVNRSDIWDSKVISQSPRGSNSSTEDNRWHIASLAVDRPPAASASQRSSAETLRSDQRSSAENSEARSSADYMHLGHMQALSSQERNGVRTSSGMLALSPAPSMRSNRSVSPNTAQQTAHTLLSNPALFRGRADASSSLSSVKDPRVPGSTTPTCKSAGSTYRSIASSDESNDSSAPSTSEQMVAASLANMANSRAREDALGLPRGATRSYSANPTFHDAKGLASSLQDWQLQQKQQSEQGSEGEKSAWGNTCSSNEERSQEEGGRAMDVPEIDDAEIDFASLDLGPRIGMGCFGEVFKAHWRQTTVAVKKFLEQSLSDQTLREFKAEVLMNKRLRHPNIIAFLGACTERPYLCIVTAWAPRGSLYHLLHNSGPVNLTLRQKLRMALDTARGMHYLHSAKPPIIHRDLKSMNLLVDNDLTIKVCDFGLARVRSGTWMTGKSHGGTPEWTAPEVLRSQSWNEKSDVYSYGVILFELVSGEKPWADMSPMQVVGAVGWGNARLEVPPNCPAFFASLMERCWGEHTRRPSFEDIIRELIQHANRDRPKSSKPDELAASTPATSEHAGSKSSGLSDKPGSGTLPKSDKFPASKQGGSGEPVSDADEPRLNSLLVGSLSLV